jgi:hypothetical protein
LPLGNVGGGCIEVTPGVARAGELALAMCEATKRHRLPAWSDLDGAPTSPRRGSVVRRAAPWEARALRRRTRPASQADAVGCDIAPRRHERATPCRSRASTPTSA